MRYNYASASGQHPETYIYRNCEIYGPIDAHDTNGTTYLYNNIIDVRDYDDYASATDCGVIEAINNNFSIISYMGISSEFPRLTINNTGFYQNGENMTIYGYNEIVVDNCEFIENSNNDLDLFNCGLQISNSLFANSHGIYFQDEIHGFTHDSLSFINNTVDNCFRGIYLTTEEDLTESIIIENNIIIDCSFYGIGLGAVPPNCELLIGYNDVCNNTENYVQCEPGLTDISVDPEFFGIAPFEHNLQPGSPCIDAGNPENSLDLDGSRADMGAFFYDHQNTPPEIIGITPVYLDTAFTGVFTEFSVEAIDLNLDSLYYSWQHNGITASQQSNYLTCFTETGTDTISITVSDGNSSDDHQWTIIVLQATAVDPQ
ncbi:MAG: hypothetical protein H8E46_09755 [FCB group bacterium]|nr:hypothetical protein [FCB group bacterium]